MADHSQAASTRCRLYHCASDKIRDTPLKDSPGILHIASNLKPTNLDQTDDLQIQAGLSCSFCGKLFVYPKDVRRHERIHTGEKPFSCPLCPYKAAQKGNVKQHMIHVHKEELTD